MATLFKRKEKRPIPDGAEIITYRSKRYAKWTDKTGKARRAPLDRAGKRVVQEAECWTAQYFDEHGKRRKVPTGCADKGTAQQVARAGALISAMSAVRKWDVQGSVLSSSGVNWLWG